MPRKPTPSNLPRRLAADGGQARHVVVGSIVSDAPAAALLAALQALRPQYDVRFDPQGPVPPHGRRYRIAVRARVRRGGPAAPGKAGAIDAWLRIKSALMSAFPEDKPGAVIPLDP